MGGAEMVAGDFFPWTSHRTMEDVEETEALRCWAKVVPYSMTSHTWRRLRELEARAVEPEGVE
jgi:hypothetical protein